MAHMNIETFNDIGDEIDIQRATTSDTGNDHLFALMHYVAKISSAMGDRIHHKDEGQHIQDDINRHLRIALVELAARAWIVIEEMDEA